MLDGYKTYITAVLIAVVAFAKVMQWITEETANTLTTMLMGGGLAFLRMGVAKAEK